MSPLRLSPPSSPPLSPLRSPPFQIPQATRFINAAGEVKKFYICRNPWKWPFSESDNHQKLFLYCIVCGVKKYTDQVWAKMPDATHQTPSICEKTTCAMVLSTLSGFVPNTHYLVEKQSPDPSVKGKEFFDEVPAVTTFIRVDHHFDKVFKKEEEMPQDYLPTFKRLESLPVESRIAEIDALYFANKKEEEGERMSLTETSDPFLKELALYRQKAVKVLDSISKQSSTTS